MCVLPIFTVDLQRTPSIGGVSVYMLILSSGVHDRTSHSEVSRVCHIAPTREVMTQFVLTHLGCTWGTATSPSPPRQLHGEAANHGCAHHKDGGLGSLSPFFVLSYVFLRPLLMLPRVVSFVA